jgi:biotin operon repressor
VSPAQPAPGADPALTVAIRALFDARDSGEEIAELMPFIRRDAEAVVKALRDAGLLPTN